MTENDCVLCNRDKSQGNTDKMFYWKLCYNVNCRLDFKNLIYSGALIL